MQLIVVPEANVHLYYKKGRVGDDPRAEERVEEMPNEDDAVKEFVRLFELITDNEFELWEREKKFVKKPLKFFSVDMVYLYIFYSQLQNLLFHFLHAVNYCRNAHRMMGLMSVMEDLVFVRWGLLLLIANLILW